VLRRFSNSELEPGERVERVEKHRHRARTYSSSARLLCAPNAGCYAVVTERSRPRCIRARLADNYVTKTRK
jgi:hypothetical protein